MGGADAGAISKAQTFDNSRSEAAAAPHLSFYRNRYYDQATGRWTQEDPIGVAGGLNLYAYVGNNPATLTDPFGLCPRITVNGKNVTIEANVQIKGATLNEERSIVSGIENAWSGDHGGYHVTVDLHKADAPVVTVDVTGRVGGGEMHGGGASYGPGKGGIIQMQVGDNATTTGRLAAHEFGHVMGNMPHSPIEGDLMYGTAGTVVTKSNVDFAIRECQLPKSEDTTGSKGGQ